MIVQRKVKIKIVKYSYSFTPVKKNIIFMFINVYICSYCIYMYK